MAVGCPPIISHGWQWKLPTFKGNQRPSMSLLAEVDGQVNCRHSQHLTSNKHGFMIDTLVISH